MTNKESQQDWEFAPLPPMESRRQFFQEIELRHSGALKRLLYLQQSAIPDVMIMESDTRVQNIELLAAGSRKAARLELMEAELLLEAPDTIGGKKSTEVQRAAWVTTRLHAAPDYGEFLEQQKEALIELADVTARKEVLISEAQALRIYLTHLDTWINFFSTTPKPPTESPKPIQAGPSGLSKEARAAVLAMRIPIAPADEATSEDAAQHEPEEELPF